MSFATGKMQPNQINSAMTSGSSNIHAHQANPSQPTRSRWRINQVDPARTADTML